MRTAVAFLFLLVFLACSPQALQATEPMAHDQVLVALGDSVTFGLGASKTCQTTAVLTPATCPNGRTYVDDLARLLENAGPVRYQNLGMRGATTVTVPVVEVPQMDPAATIVVVYAGSTDQIPIARGTEHIEDWREDYLWGLAAIRERAPRVRIVLATVPVIANAPGDGPGSSEALAQTERSKAASVASEMNAFILSLPYDIVDFRCDPDMYDPTLHDGPDDAYHFNDVGYARMAAVINRVLANGSDERRKSCSPYTDMPTLDRWYEPFLAS